MASYTPKCILYILFFPGGGTVQRVTHTRGCVEPEQCSSGSVTFGSERVVYHTECCDSDLCNDGMLNGNYEGLHFPQPPSTTRSGCSGCVLIGQHRSCSQGGDSRQNHVTQEENIGPVRSIKQKSHSGRDEGRPQTHSSLVLFALLDLNVL